MIDTMLLVCLIVLLPSYQLWRSRIKTARPPRSRSATYVQATIKPASLVALLAIDWLVADRPISLLGLDWPLSHSGSIGFAITFAVLIALAATARFQKPSSDPAMRRDAAIMEPETPEEVWLFILFAVTLGAGWEIALPRLSAVGTGAAHRHDRRDRRCGHGLRLRAWLQERGPFFGEHRLSLRLHDRLCVKPQPVVADAASRCLAIDRRMAEPIAAPVKRQRHNRPTLSQFAAVLAATTGSSTALAPAAPCSIVTVAFW